MIWRLLEDGAGEAAWNMAADETLMESVAAHKMPPTLRLYSWKQPSVTLGRFQNVRRTIRFSALPFSDNEIGTTGKASIDQYLAAGNMCLPVVRRISGGRGILHGSDLTLSLAAMPEAIGLPSTASTRQVYARVATGLIRAFGVMGIAAQMGECQRCEGTGTLGDCFDIVSNADIVSAKNGRKLLGSALHRRGSTFLQQISIPFPASQDEINSTEALKAAVFSGHFSVEKNGEESCFGSSNIRAAFVDGLACSLELSFTSKSLTREEVERTKELVKLRYQQFSWTWQGRDSTDLSTDNEKTD